MALDGFVLHTITRELRDALCGGIVEQVYQKRLDIVLKIVNQGTGYHLHLSADPMFPRALLSCPVDFGRGEPPFFCQLLRKRLRRARLVDVSQQGFERILTLRFQGRDEVGDPTAFSLVVELTGRHSNIILLEKDIIVGAVKHVPRETSRRPILPGISYELPPVLDKLDPREEQDVIAEHLTGSQTVAKGLTAAVSGIGQTLASEIAFRVGIPAGTALDDLDDARKSNLAGELGKIAVEVSSGSYEPCVYFSESGLPVDFHCLALKTRAEFKQQSFATTNEAASTYFRKALSCRKQNELRSRIESALTQKLSQLDRTQEARRRELATAREDLNCKKLGELLAANLHHIKGKQESITVTDFTENGSSQVTIALDPSLTPGQNLDKYFKRYKKAERTIAALEETIAETDKEIAYLKGVEGLVGELADGKELEAINDELEVLGYLKQKTRKKKGHEDRRRFRRFKSSEGFSILVGRNNVGNDLLVRSSAPGDLWLHVKQHPGSHVVIKTERRQVPQKTIREAALLAAYYSRAKHSSNVPVDYTEVRFVNKPKGARPGFVTYTRENTLYVTPERSKVASLTKLS